MRKMIAAVVAAGLVVSAWLILPGLAASMTDASQTEGAGNTAVARCDTDGVTTVYGLNSTNVTSVVVSNVASGCAGLTMKATINNQATTSSGTAVVPAGGGTVTVGVTSIALTQAMQTEIQVG